MKLFLSHLLLASLTVSSFAQQMPKETVDTKAKAILDELSKKTKAYTSIKAEFGIVVTGADKKEKENSSGALSLKGTKYKLDVKGQSIYCDGKNQWTYIPESKEVQINCAPDPNKTESISPVNIFTLYEKGFKSVYFSEETVGTAKCDVIDLYPLDPKGKKYHRVTLYIDKTKKQIVQVKIFSKTDQSVTTITVKSFTANSEMPDTTFTFDIKKFPGTEEVDLREDDCK